MGHVQLGVLPRTKAWTEVVRLLQAGALPEQIANASARAAETGLAQAAKDQGVIETVYVLMQLPIAARTDDFNQALNDRGFLVSGPPGLMDLTAAFSERVDCAMFENGWRTDVGELAQMSAVETLATQVHDRVPVLFGTAPADVQQALAQMFTVKHFGALAKQFFGRFLFRCLDYYLSRALPMETGAGKRFPTLAEQMAFSQALQVHCVESARYVDKFSGQWLSATYHQEEALPRPLVEKYTYSAMTKLIRALRNEVQTDD